MPEPNIQQFTQQVGHISTPQAAEAFRSQFGRDITQQELQGFVQERSKIGTSVTSTQPKPQQPTQAITPTPTRPPTQTGQPVSGTAIPQVDDIYAIQERTFNLQLQSAEADFQSASQQLDAIKSRADEQNRLLIDNIKARFETRVSDMKQVNAARLGNLTTIGFRTGRARFTPDIQGGLLSNEEREGISRISSLENERDQLIIEATNAAEEANYEYFNNRMMLLKEKRGAERTALLGLAEAQSAFETRIAAKQKAIQENQRFQWDLEDPHRRLHRRHMDCGPHRA